MSLPSVRRLLAIVVLFCLGSGAAAVGADEEAFVSGAVGGELSDGVVLERRLSRNCRGWIGRIRVPAEATALTLFLSATGEVDLFASPGKPPQPPFEAHASVGSRRPGGSEVLRIERGGQRGLVTGDWFVAVDNTRRGLAGARFEIVALLEVAGGPRTLLPGVPFDLRLPANVGMRMLRTPRPRRVPRIEIRTEGAGDAALAYVLAGPQGVKRSAGSGRPLVVDGESDPAGTWHIEVRRKKGETGEKRVRLLVGWGAVAASPASVLGLGRTLPLVLGGDDHPVLGQLRLDVPPGIPGFRVDASSASGVDVDLFLRRGQPPGDGLMDAEWFQMSRGARESLIVGGARPLGPGPWFLEVALANRGHCHAVRVDVRLEPRAGLDAPASWGTQAPTTLTPGTWIKGLVPAGGGITYYALPVPAGTTSLHATLLGAEAPLDLLLLRRTDGSIVHRAITPRVDERLDHVFPTPPDGERQFVLGVMGRSPREPDAAFRLSVGFDEPVELPLDHAWPPILSPKGLSPSEQAAAATVELTVLGGSGGTGCCMTPRGLILTCHHVLRSGRADDGIQREGVLIAFPRRLDEAPVQAFVARVVAVDERADLALLEITSDIFGRALPEHLVLPFMATGDDEGLRLGGKVAVCGYPVDGSARARTPVILTHGSVAGLEREGQRLRWIKTDAWVGLGHSGGALLDEHRRLVGIAAATLGKHDSLGLVVPLSRVPAAWRRRIQQGAGAPR
jgi:S1-C subfamily serine protease